MADRRNINQYIKCFNNEDIGNNIFQCKYLSGKMHAFAGPLSYTSAENVFTDIHLNKLYVVGSILPYTISVKITQFFTRVSVSLREDKSFAELSES